MWVSGGRAFPPEGSASAKVLRQDCPDVSDENGEALVAGAE